MTGNDPDAVLVERIAHGDPAAVRLLVNAKLPRVLAMAVRMLRDRGEAEDVAQELFEKVWRHAGRWRPGAARFDTWIHTVTLNLCRDRLRRRRETSAELPDRADPAPAADAKLIEDQRARRVTAAVGALPERQREAILLVHYQDMTNIEAAAVLDVSVEALESLLARGRRALRRMLAEGIDEQD